MSMDFRNDFIPMQINHTPEGFWEYIVTLYETNLEHNEITFRLYNIRERKGNIEYYNAGIGFYNSEWARILNGDPCPYKITVGIEQGGLKDRKFIQTLIMDLLNERRIVNGTGYGSKVDLENGIYINSKGQEFPVGNYVGELRYEVDINGKPIPNRYKKFFDGQIGKKIYDEMANQIESNKDINRRKREIEDRYDEELRKLEVYCANKRGEILARRRKEIESLFLDSPNNGR